MATESVGARSTFSRKSRTHKSIRLRFVDVDYEPKHSSGFRGESSSSSSEDELHEGTTVSLTRRANFPRSSWDEESSSQTQRDASTENGVNIITLFRKLQ